MNLETYFEFLSPREIKLKGHRIWLQDILYEYIHRGMTLEELGKRFDSLSREEILATLLYYHHNQEAMDKYLAEWLEYSRSAREQDTRNHPAWYEKIKQLQAQREAARRQAAS
jgi:uncharacterized protein (DUF433 family)